MNDLHRDSARLHDDLAAYALDALGGDEAAALERHLEGCESCRARLEWLRPAVDQLPVAVEQRTPPPRLRESLMATVRAEAAPAAAGEPRERPARSWWEGLRAALRQPVAGMAVLVLLVVGVATGYLLRGGNESEFVPAHALSASAPAASATLERHGDSATLHVDELPPLARDQVYEVWVKRAGVLEPSSTFVLARDHSAEAAVPGPLDGAEAVLVTAEPRPGSSRPTSQPLLEASLQ